MTFFVSYHLSTDDGQGFGNCQVTLSNKALTVSTVNELRAALKREHPNAIILNIIPLEDEA